MFLDVDGDINLGLEEFGYRDLRIMFLEVLDVWGCVAQQGYVIYHPGASQDL